VHVDDAVPGTSSRRAEMESARGKRASSSATACGGGATAEEWEVRVTIRWGDMRVEDVVEGEANEWTPKVRVSTVPYNNPACLQLTVNGRERSSKK